MSIQQSYLSKRVGGSKVYDADMVTAISEQALNSQMRQYLSSSTCNWEIKVYFLQTMNENGDDVYFMLQKDTDESTIPSVFELAETVESLKKQNSCIFDELEKLKLFDLEPGTSIEDPRLAKAMDYCFGYAVHLADGIPSEIFDFAANSGADIDKVLNIVTLDIDRKSVIFNQFFKEFEVIQLNLQMKRGKVDGRLTKAVQNCGGDNPINSLWSTRATINVDLRKVDYKHINNPDVVAKIKSLCDVSNPEDAFDISQLLLDLSTLQLVSPLTIEGVTPDVNEKLQGYIRDFFNRLENAGQTVFGHSIIPKENKDKLSKPYLFVPCKQNFDMGGVIVRDENGIEKSRNVALYYLMNLEDGHNYDCPSLGNNRDFEWKPLLSESNAENGVMAICATKFIPLIRQNVVDLLSRLLRTRYPYWVSNWKGMDIVWSEMNVPDPHFTVPEESPWQTKLSYCLEYNQDWMQYLIAFFKICTKYSVDCFGHPGTCVLNGITYPSYDFEFHIVGWMNFGIEGENNEGVYYENTFKFQVAVGINDAGEFEFHNVCTGDNPVRKEIEIHTWSEFVTVGTVNKVVNSMTDYQANQIQRTIDQFKTGFLRAHNSYSGWFMPGAKTFTYKNEGISDFGDLYCHLNYVQGDD